MGPKCYDVQCIFNGEEGRKPLLGLGDAAYRKHAEGVPSHGHRQHAQKFGKDRPCGSGDILADRQTHRQTCTSQYFATAHAGDVITFTTNSFVQRFKPWLHVQFIACNLLQGC